MSFQKYSYYAASIPKLLLGMKPWTRVLQVFLGRIGSGDHLIQLKKSGLRFHTRGKMDIWSVKETFLDRFYERFGTPIEDGWTVIDIGGGIGDFTIFAALGFPNNSVYAFEPTPGSFELLQKNLRLNGLARVQAFPEAIWAENGTLAMDTTTGEPGQFTSHAGTSSADPTKVTVPSISLEEVFNRLELTGCDLLKIDCEGAEYAILFYTPDVVLNKIQRIVLEYHDGVTEFNHQDLANFLSQHGFKVETFANFVHRDLGYLRALREDS